jgi:hypothetical protein
LNFDVSDGERLMLAGSLLMSQNSVMGFDFVLMR